MQADRTGQFGTGHSSWWTGETSEALQCRKTEKQTGRTAKVTGEGLNGVSTDMVEQVGVVSRDNLYLTHVRMD